MKKSSPLKQGARDFNASVFGRPGSNEQAETKSNETLEGEGPEKAMPAYFDTKTRPTAKDLFGGGKNLSKEGPFSGLKTKLENKQKVRRDKNSAKYTAEKGGAFNKIVDTGAELPKQDYTLPKEEIDRPSDMPEIDESSFNPMPFIPEIDESSLDLSAFQQVSDGYNRAMMRGKLYQMSAEYKKMKNGK
jgi:hypothetical protein